jgi:hypothetical protein
MPLASKLSMLTMLSAKMKGITNEVSRKPMFKFTGEMLIVIRSSPTVRCHQGKTSDTAITKSVITPPARANQLNLIKILYTFFTPEKLDLEPASHPSGSHSSEFVFH